MEGKAHMATRQSGRSGLFFCLEASERGQPGDDLGTTWVRPGHDLGATGGRPLTMLGSYQKRTSWTR